MYLHFSDNTTDVPRDHPEYDKLKKVSLVVHVDTFNDQSRKFFTLGDCVSVDELMIKFYGRTYLKVFMKDKPIRWGFKFWSLNDPQSGYFYRINPYICRKDTRRGSNKRAWYQGGAGSSPEVCPQAWYFSCM